MANIKWKCNDCEPNHYFEGDKFTYECPSCSSENIEEIKEDRFGFYLKYLQDNWKIVLPIILGLFLLLLWLNKEPSNGSSGTIIYIVDRIEQKPGTNYLEISMISKDTVSGKKEVLSESKQIEMISRFISSISIVNEKKQIPFEKNRLYLCEIDTTSELYFTIVYKGQRVPMKYTTVSALNGFNLNGLQPDSKAKCKEKCPITTHDISLKAKKCKLFVSIKNIPLNMVILVSVDGINGDYKPHKFEWDIKSISKYDVWVKIENSIFSPIASMDNGSTPPKNTCNECNEKEKENMTIKLSQALNEWSQDPNNRDLYTHCYNLYKTYNDGSNKFVVNSKEFQNWSEMVEDITIQNSNPPLFKKFKLKYPVKILNDCSDVTIEFIYD